MQLLAGSRIIEVYYNVKEDRALFNGAQNLLGILITVSEPITYVVSGMYGDLGMINAGNALSHQPRNILTGGTIPDCVGTLVKKVL